MEVLRHLRELWLYRELVRNLVVRDLKVRYRDSILGIAWSWLNPLLMMIVYSIFFTIALRDNSIPHYPVFLLCGLLPWNFSNDSILQATGSITGNAHLVKKVYFPREVLPISIVLSNLVNFFIALPIFFGLALISGAPLSWSAFLLPVTILIQVAFTTGLALLLATLNVFYRDAQHILSVIMLAWFFLTPVIYPIDTVPEEAWLTSSTTGVGMAVFYSNEDIPAGATLLCKPIQVRLWLRRLNPMASIIASYRDLLCRGQPTGLDFLIRTAVIALIVLIAGYLVFLRYSPRLGEEV